MRIPNLISTFFYLLLGLALTEPAAAQSDDVSSIVKEWTESAHADAAAEAFTHWNDEGQIPAQCALCHAGAGLRDFHGLDGTAPGVDGPQPIGGVIDCDTCHVEGAMQIAEVQFPSGVSIAAPPGNGTCYTCHQGRQSGLGVAAATAGTDDDTVNPELNFLNPHYKAAAASLYGASAAGMYQYEGQDYAGRFAHVAGAQVCSDCHNPHSLKVDAATCAGCHGVDDPKAIRVQWADFDGDGDAEEGLYGEITTLQEELSRAIAAYARDTAGTPVVYAAARYPYFFADLNGNGAEDEGEAVYPNRYASWTPRMLRAAYNYQFVAKDPGGYAHNPRYIIQVLQDSLADIRGEPVIAARP